MPNGFKYYLLQTGLFQSYLWCAGLTGASNKMDIHQSVLEFPTLSTCEIFIFLHLQQLAGNFVSRNVLHPYNKKGNVVIT
jgi:hypothetical protein